MMGNMRNQSEKKTTSYNIKLKQNKKKQEATHENEEQTH